jgi:uncharacterized protein (UPF0261 family)
VLKTMLDVLRRADGGQRAVLVRRGGGGGTYIIAPTATQLAVSVPETNPAKAPCNG